jgi:VWFA-related protein
MVLVLLGISAAQNPTSQQKPETAETKQEPTVRARTTVVLAPTLVKDAKGEVIFGLTADDFIVTDDGVEQKVLLDETPETKPVSLVVAIQKGGRAEYEFSRMKGLDAMLQPLFDTERTRIALVEFDSQVELVHDFTNNGDMIGYQLKKLSFGDDFAAILDAVNFSIGLLEKEPKERRRVLLLISETRDHGSIVQLKDAVTAIENSNTVVYSLAFSPSLSNIKDTMQGRNEDEIGALPNFLNVIVLAMKAMKQNVPKMIAEMTGGEYELFKTKNGFSARMNSFDNHLHSRYLLSFEPKGPHVGPHVVSVKLRKERKDAVVLARTGYWVNETE